MQIYDIWAGLLEDREALIVFMLWVAWGAAVIYGIIRSIGGARLNHLEYLSLAAGGWVLPLLGLSLLILTLGGVRRVDFLRPALLVFMICSAGLALWRFARAGRISRLDLRVWFLAAVVLLTLILVRLPFLTKTLLPLYFDSAEHYRIAATLVHSYQGTGWAHFAWPVSSYYHLGFHFIAAALTSVSQLKLERLILVIGQVVLALAPLSLFFIVRRETESNLAGLFAIVLGAFGWYMPAHAVNWGKYPALLSLVPSLFALNILYVYVQGWARSSGRQGLAGLISLSVLTSFLVHTRSIILIAIGAVSWMLAQQWERRPATDRLLFLGLVLFGLAVEIVYLVYSPILGALLDPYFNDAIWITIAVGLLAIPAFPGHSRTVFACLVFILLLISSLFIPVSTNLFLTLLDRPYVEMSLFIPLSILGGLGFADVIRLPVVKSVFLKTAVAASLLGLVMLHAFAKYDFYPSDCCRLVGSDDLLVLDWIAENLPANARILIPSSEIKITPSGDPPQNAGSDAGVWIAPLTGRTTVSVPYQLDFSQMLVWQDICSQKITHVFIGGTAESFNTELLGVKPAWYETVLIRPNARVYRVAGCA